MLNRKSKRKTKSSQAAKDILRAAKLGQFDVVRRFLKNGVEADPLKLFDAAITDFRTIPRKPGHTQISLYLLDQGLDPHSRIGWLNEPLVCVAAKFGNQAVVDKVLKDGFTPSLFEAAAIGDLASVKRDLQRDTVNRVDNNGFNALHYCAASALGLKAKTLSSALAQIARMLIRNGAECDLDCFNQLHITPLFLVAWFGGNAQIANQLLDAGADANHLEFALEPHQRSGAPNTHIAELLLKRGADLERRTPPHGRTLLHACANRGSNFPVQWLLENGANPNARNDFGQTPLHLAAERNTHTTVVELLMQYGAEINARDQAGLTPLATAEANERTAVATFLKSRGAR